MVVGSGWRAEFYLRAAAAIPQWLTACSVVTRSPERGSQVQDSWGIPTYRSIAQAVAATDPDFVVIAVPWDASADAIEAAVQLSVPVLAETPPAPDADGLATLWDEVGSSGLVQVAEQYPRYPGHAARLTLIRSGLLGSISNVQVCSTHHYHAMALIRGMLGVGVEQARVSTIRTEFALADPMSREGWNEHARPQAAWNLLTHLDFGDGRSGLFDFTDNQWHNPLRSRRIVIRGSLGEVVDDQVVRLSDPHTVVTDTLHRRQTGIDMNLEGFDLDHITHEGKVLYRNRWHGSRFSDEELAIADLLVTMADFARNEGPAPYPLAQACQDHLLGLAIDESARLGTPVTTKAGPWAMAGAR